MVPVYSGQYLLKTSGDEGHVQLRVSDACEEQGLCGPGARSSMIVPLPVPYPIYLGVLGAAHVYPCVDPSQSAPCLSCQVIKQCC